MRNIRIYFDFSCPYCYNEWNFMKKIREQVELEEDYYSWEIHPDAPLEGKKLDFPDMKKRFKELNELGAPVGAAPGNMEKVYNTKKALQLLEEAKKQGLELPYIETVFHAYFVDQVNIADDKVILPLAEKVGVKGAAEVLAEGRYLDTILEHDKHCMDIGLEYVPTVYEGEKKILEGVLTFDMVKKEFGYKE